MGGFEVSIAWEQGLLSGGEVRSTNGGPCRVEGPGIAPVELYTDPGQEFGIEAG